MAAAVISLTKPADVRGFSSGNKRVRFFDLTSDTGDYAPGGFTLTAAQFGLKHIDCVQVCSMATQGSTGASALGVGITYVSAGTSVLVQLYESAGSGSPPVEKGAEAMVANFTVRLRAEGTGTGA